MLRNRRVRQNRNRLPSPLLRKLIQSPTGIQLRPQLGQVILLQGMRDEIPAFGLQNGAVLEEEGS